MFPESPRMFPESHRMFPESHRMFVMHMDPTPTGEVRAGETVLQMIG
jgi:hypothetical protein